jgi:metallo-beta-lactamase family protein
MTENLVGGLFQGVKPIRIKLAALASVALYIECVLLTNGHLDHCGWLPFG